jgi:hypothetical protein
MTRKTAEEILFIRDQATAALELTKGFTPEQRAEFSNSLKTVELFAGYIIELANTSAAQEVEEYKERLKSEIGERITNDNHANRHGEMSDEREGKIHITGNPEKGSWVKDLVNAIPAANNTPSQFKVILNSMLPPGTMMVSQDIYDGFKSLPTTEPHPGNWGGFSGTTERIPQNE